MRFFGGPLHGKERVISGPSVVWDVPFFEPVVVAVGTDDPAAVVNFVRVRYSLFEWMRLDGHIERHGHLDEDSTRIWTRHLGAEALAAATRPLAPVQTGGLRRSISRQSFIAERQSIIEWPYTDTMRAEAARGRTGGTAGLASPDAMRFDASSDEAEEEMAAWRSILDGAKRASGIMGKKP